MLERIAASFLFGLPIAVIMLGVLLAALWRAKAWLPALAVTVLTVGGLAVLAAYRAVVAGNAGQDFLLFYIGVVASGVLLGAGVFWMGFLLIQTRGRTAAQPPK